MATERLCAVADLPEGAARVFEVGDFRLAAARSGTTVFVLEDRCSHDDGELGSGAVTCTTDDDDNERVEIECPRHGARFDMATGAQTRMPAVSPIESFPARVDGDDVYVDLPEY